MDGDGDITRPENITAFRNFVLESTERRGLHFIMADGVRLFHPIRLKNPGSCSQWGLELLTDLVLVCKGFSVEGQENLQEILSKQLLLCQFLTALSTLRTGV